MTGMIHRSLEKAALKGSGSGAKKSASPMQSEAKQMFSASSRPRLPLIISNDTRWPSAGGCGSVVKAESGANISLPMFSSRMAPNFRLSFQRMMVP